VEAFSHSAEGVHGHSDIAVGVKGTGSVGLYGESHGASNVGVIGYSLPGLGIYGYSNTGTAVSGFCDNARGVSGISTNGYAIYGTTTNGWAAYLDGRVYIRGPLQKPGGQFKIDHPLDPTNKYLSHSFVESPDMKNVYDGVVVLDDKGEAEIELPDWFGALNKDFRYQLTAIGAPGPNLYVAEEISEANTNYSNRSSSSRNNNNNHFKIAGGTSGMKVSWQVTGIRKDPYAKAHPVQVEEDKPEKERGYYLHPNLYGEPEQKLVSRLLIPELPREPT
jgi:hypothetical protein